MSNADFYNNIQKQAATMKDSYPELNQMISGQTSATKKTSQEKPKKLNIQMSPNNSANKLSIIPSKIEGRSSNKITIIKDPSSSNTTVPTSDNKNTNDNFSLTRPKTKQGGLKIKLDPNLIKVRSKSTDSGIPPQSISNNTKISDNLIERSATQNSKLPPGFENIQSKPPENNLNMPPGFSQNIKSESISNKEKQDTQNSKLPPGFENIQSKPPENDLNMPPGFSQNIKSEPINKKEKQDFQETKLPPGFENIQSKPPENDLNMPPGFSQNIKSEPINKKEKQEIQEMKLPPIFVENIQSKPSENSMSMPPSFSFNIKKESTITDEQPAPQEMKLPPIFVENIQNEPTENNLSMPPGFSFNIKEESSNTRESSSTSTKKEIEPHIIQKETNSTNDTPLSSNDKINNIANETQIEKEIENKIELKTENDKKDENINIQDIKSTNSITEPQTNSHFKISIEKLVSNKSNDISSENESEKPKTTPIPLDILTKSTESSESSQEQKPYQHEQSQDHENKDINSPIKQDNHENIISQLQQQEKTEQLDQLKHHELKEKPDKLEPHEPKENLEQIEHHEPKEIPDEDYLEKDHFDQDDQEFNIQQFSFDDNFDDLQFMEDLRFEYEEEEEEEEEEEPERHIILPNQLIAQPLEIEKRTPISTDISVETIDTAFPFASYDDLDTQNDHQERSNHNQYENFDSSQFPTSYGINETIAYAFKQKGSRINVFDLNQSRLISFQSNNLTSITAKGNVIVGSGNKELSFFKIANETHCSRNKFDLNNATSLAADPLDQTRFFFFTEHDHSLYIVRYNELKTKKDLIANDVLSFDLCSKYLIIVSSTNGGTINCITRKEGPLSTLWKRSIPSSTSSSTSSSSTSSFNSMNGFNCFITDDYYIEKVGKTVTIYEANTLNKIQTLSHIVHVFKGGGDPIFLLTNGTIIHFKNVYRFPRPVICAVANKDSVIAWYSLDYAPYAKKTVSGYEKQMTVNKHTMKVMHTTIINKTTSFLKNFSSRLCQKEQLFKIIDESIQNSENQILKFNNEINDLAELVKSMTHKSSPIDECFKQIENNQFESGFENSLKLEKDDFIMFLDDKNINYAFHSINNSVENENDNDNPSERIILSDDLIMKLAVKISGTIDEGCIWMVDRLNILLMCLNDEKRKIVVQTVKEKIVQIIQVFGANVHEENTLIRIDTLNQILSASVD